MFNFRFIEFKFSFIKSKVTLLLKRFDKWWGILFAFVLINLLILVLLFGFLQTNSQIKKQILQTNQVSSNTVYRKRILDKIEDLKEVIPRKQIIYSSQYTLNGLKTKIQKSDIFISEKSENILKILDQLWKKHSVQKSPDLPVLNSPKLDSTLSLRQQFINFAQWYQNNIYKGFVVFSLEKVFPDLDKNSQIYRFLNFFLNKMPNYSRYKFDFRISENAILKTTLTPENNFVEYLEYWKNVNTPSLIKLKQIFVNKLDGFVYGNSKTADTPWPVSNSLTPVQAWKKIQYWSQLQFLKLLTKDTFPKFDQQTLININLEDLKQELFKQFRSPLPSPLPKSTMDYNANTHTFQFKFHHELDQRQTGKTYKWKFKFHLTSGFLVEKITKTETKWIDIPWWFDEFRDSPSEEIKPENNQKYFAWI